MQKASKWLREHPAMAAILFSGLLLRLLGIGFGLPATLHPDEPHHINVAVYFGSGDLNPHVFKYPTLWMYSLTFLYGIFYLLWSGFTLLKSTADFAHLFVWDPSVFYLIARAASALCGSAAIFGIYACARQHGLKNGAILAAGFMALSPVLTDNSHYAKPDMMMLVLSTLSWWACVKISEGDSSLKTYAVAGLALGLAISSQYTAAMILILPVLAVLGGGYKISLKLALCYALTVIGFFIGTPYALLDFGTFLKDIRDVFGSQSGTAIATPERAGLCPLWLTLNAWGWPALVWGAVLAAGCYEAWKKNWRKALFLTAPAILGVAFLATLSVHACSPRYMFAFFPGLLLAAGYAAEADWTKRWKFLTALLLVVPLMGSILQLPRFYKSDTRVEAKKWIEQNIPVNSVILMDQIHASPPLAMSKEQAQRLFEKTSEVAHPRAQYYKALLQGHPGGGYEIIRLQRTTQELASMERHVQWSKEGYDLIDAEGGIEDLRKEGIQYVITTSLGATPENSPRLLKFFHDLENKAELIKNLEPADPASGPALHLYKL